MKQWPSILVLISIFSAGCTEPYRHIPLAPPSSYKHAEDALRSAEFATAAAGFTTVLTTVSGPTYRGRAYYRLAQAHYGLEHYQAALEVLQELEAEFPDQHWPQTAALRGDAHYALHDRVEAILDWEMAWHRAREADRQVLRPRIEGAIVELSSDEARHLAGLLSVAAIRELLVARLPQEFATTYTVDAAGAERATGVVRQSVRADVDEIDSHITPMGSTDARDDVKVMPEGPVIGVQADAPKVACLLPLTGPDRLYGQRTLRGLRLAFAESPDSLLVRDTGSDAHVASEIIPGITADPTVLAIIGPMRNSEAAMIAPLAEKLEIPLLLLSQGEEPNGEFVMQVGITQRQQVRAIVNYAVDVLRIERFAVTHPDDRYGHSFMREFRDEVMRQGATLVGSSAYRTGQEDFSGQAEAVRRWMEDGGIDSVFIPDAAHTATAVAEAVRRAAPDVVLLGSESWNHAPTLVQAAGAVEGAIFADAFFADRSAPSTQRFITEFRELNGQWPTVFEAQGYDIAMLVRRIIALGARTRTTVLKQLREAAPFDGAGRIYTTGDGLQRELFLLRVRQGRVEEVRSTVTES